MSVQDVARSYVGLTHFVSCSVRVVQSLALAPELRVQCLSHWSGFSSGAGRNLWETPLVKGAKRLSLVKKVLMKPVLNFNLMRRVRLPMDVSKYTLESDVTPTEGGLGLSFLLEVFRISITCI